MTNIKETCKGANRHGLPIMFKPLLWSLKWDSVNINEDKEDIVMAAINEGTLEHWRWIIRAYGKDEIQKILAKRLVTEFHPESYYLAKTVFNLPTLRYGR
jgi:hypothetical protein